MSTQNADPECLDCGGEGVIETPFEERGGEIVGGDIVPCHCTKIKDDYEKDEDDDSDSADSGDSEGEDTGF